MSSTASPVIDLDCSARRLHRAVSAAALVMVALSCVTMISGSFEPLVHLFLESISLAVIVMGLWSCGWLGSRRPVRRATWTSTGLWYVVAADGHRHEAILQPHSRILPMAVWLHWRSGPLHFQAFLFSTDIPRDVRRRLRTRIRFESTTPANALEPPTS